MANRLHHKDGDGGDSQKRADAVRDGVGYLLAQRVLAHVALPVRLVRRGFRGLVAMGPSLAQVARLELRRGPGMGSGRRCRGLTGAGRHIRRCGVCRFSIHRHQLYHTRSITAPVCCAPVAKRLRSGSQRLASGVILGNGTPGAKRRKTSISRSAHAVQRAERAHQASHEGTRQGTPVHPSPSARRDQEHRGE